jgi:molybdopterin molybdotransferase
MKMRPFGRLVPVATVLARLQSATVPVRATESVALAAAAGRVAARAYRAPGPVPPFPRATWDGYAIRSADTRRASADRPVRLRLVGEVFAEERLGRAVGAGEAAAVATGGAMPPGTDAVLIFEEAHPASTSVSAERFIPAGERVAAAGADIAAGRRLVGRDEVLDPATLGAVGATGRARLTVYRRPRVALLSNGNELAAPGDRRRANQVYDVNGVTLASVVQAAGGEASVEPPLPDDPGRIESAIRRAVRAHDLVVVTGGSSVGEHDFLPSIFPRLGRLLFHGVAVRPGKPTLAAVRGNRLLLGLPGHPTSCLSNGLWMLLPLVRRLAHLPGPGWTEGTVRLGASIPAVGGALTSVVPLRVVGGVAWPTFRDSSAITSLAGANAFLMRPGGSVAVPPGRRVLARLLPPPIGRPVDG